MDTIRDGGVGRTFPRRTGPHLLPLLMLFAPAAIGCTKPPVPEPAASATAPSSATEPPSAATAGEAAVATTIEPPTQAAEAGTRAGEVRSDNVLNMKMVWCPAGKFLMGSPGSDQDAEPEEKPQVETELTSGFWLGKYEVTQREWKDLMGTEPWKAPNTVWKEGGEYAVTQVTWEDAQAFCRKLTEREVAAAMPKAAWRFRLPTEAEWEYACRAGSRTRYAFGDDAEVLEHYAWYEKNAHRANEHHAHIVGLKGSNAWGLHDMHGNVSEWCEDWYGEKSAGGRNPPGPAEGSVRVYRGGCWFSEAASCRSAFRIRVAPSLHFGNLGFRVARVPSGE